LLSYYKTDPIEDGHEENHPSLGELREQGKQEPGQQQPRPLRPQSGQQDERQEGHVEVGQCQEVDRDRKPN